MSLLMDALNKAEQAKRQGQATEADASAPAKAAPPPLTLELTPLMSPDAPAAASAPALAPPALPELPAHLGVLDDEFIAHAATAKPGAKEKPEKPEKTPPRSAPVESLPTPAPAVATAGKASTASGKAQKTDTQDREAAQNLFDAKQPARPRPNKRLLMVLGLVFALAASAIGVYFWLQLQPSGGLSLLTPAANIPRPLGPPAQPDPPVPPEASPAAPVNAATPATPVVPPLPANDPARPAAAPARGEPASTFHVSTSKATLNPSLANGYEAYLASNFAAAGNEYLQVLKDEPSNLDALHGMAAIALRQGQYAAAEEYYLRAIEADPKDTLAQAGLIGLKSQVDPQKAETRLNALIATQPDLPYLHFALGNLYAQQNRWNEAQASFFKAFSGEPDNPDTLFNLAVSLDQLHQSRLALQYYNLALAAAARRPASFDKAQVSARLRELQP